jgi:hypothetical protein
VRKYLARREEVGGIIFCLVEGDKRGMGKTRGMLTSTKKERNPKIMENHR